MAQTVDLPMPQILVKIAKSDSASASGRKRIGIWLIARRIFLHVAFLMGLMISGRRVTIDQGRSHSGDKNISLDSVDPMDFPQRHVDLLG